MAPAVVNGLAQHARSVISGGLSSLPQTADITARGFDPAVGPLVARSILAARDGTPAKEDPKSGVTSPGDINNTAIFVLFGLIGAAFVVTGIWFFFWAKNGGFYFKEDDWDDYKSTVLRRKGPNGTILSNATKSTKLGGGSVYKDYDDNQTSISGTTLSGITAGASDIAAREKRERKKEKRRREKKEGRHSEKRSRRNNDEASVLIDEEAEREAKQHLRSYRHERPARVGGMNKESESSEWDGSTNPTESSVSSNLLSNRETTPTSTPTKGGIRKVYSTADRNEERERQRIRAEAKRLQEKGRSAGSSRRDFSFQRASTIAEDQATRGYALPPPQEEPEPSVPGAWTESDITSAVESDYGNKSYHHVIPGLSSQSADLDGVERPVAATAAPTAPPCTAATRRKLRTDERVEDPTTRVKMTDDEQWSGMESTMEDPEETKVIFCALDSFLQYAKVAHFNVTHLRRQSFYALPQAHWQMLAAPPFNFLDTLERTDEAIDTNAELARAIAQNGLRSCGGVDPGSGEPRMPDEWVGVAKHNDTDKARSTLRQFFRDWSADGAEERRACYGPVLDAVAHERQDAAAAPLKVLVPGAGLGRLVFELCRAGHDAEGNEISYHQLLASSYILNCTTGPGQHTVYPWVHSFSNHRTRTNHLRSCAIPDIHPASALAAAGPSVGSMSMCAADFLCLYADAEHADAYDAVATVFFLDTAPNLIRYLETIHHCLRPGGVLINFGPLLWHFENNAPGNHGKDTDGDGEHDYNNSSGIADPGSFELSDDEVMALVERVGFVVERRETGIEAPYIHDRESMLSTTYRASFWVARKPR
ncbi:Carnosine N-methyltransferase [Colletotrichum sp. SAR 10_66]|nr:Carnosine N-methyltransferase [Colletotrichum sp. SAR 10_66]